MIRALVAGLLIGTSACPAVLYAQEAPARVAPIASTERTLANGLRVYAIRDTGTSNVAVQVWYDVGSKDDPKGRSGFAHMFEHLMFKATRNLVPEQMDRLTEDVGGYNNATTGDDITQYYEVVPANHLRRLLFAEADRMASLVVEPKSFASERDVVKEELRQSTLAQPYGKLFSIYAPAISYGVHPYARSTIGSLSDLDAAGIEDVRAFHATYYRPDNAVLIVAGNFDPARLDEWVDQYFAGIKRPASAIPRVTVAEPPRTVAVSKTVYEPNTPLPAVLVSYGIPADRDADMPALQVLDAILSTGDSSRLHEHLVYRDQLAAETSTSLDGKQGPGTFQLFAILAGGKSVEAGEAALRRETAALRDAPVTAAELARAKNQILTAAIQRRETAEGKGFALGRAVIVDGDPRAADRKLAAIAGVTAADVQRVARKYLNDAQSATIRYLPIEARPAGAKSDAIGIAPTVAVADLPPVTIVNVTPASAAERVAPPAPGQPVAATLPKPVETRLANGLRVITVERHGLPIVTAQLVATGGAALDAPGRAGTGSLAATVMTKGTTTRSATAIAQGIEALGGSIDSGADRDGSNVGVTMLSSALPPAMDILADVARHPAFAAEEIDRARAQAIDGVALTVKDPRQLAGLAGARLVFGASPYGAPVAGTATSLKAITRGDLTRAYAMTWRPDQSALVMVGDITPDAAKALAEKAFGDWRAIGPAAPAMATAPLPEPRTVVIDMPDAGQAGVVVARAEIARADPLYYPLAVANSVLGGGFSSRLNQEIRIKRGLAYGAFSSLTARRSNGILAAGTSTKNPTAAEVVALITGQMAGMTTTPATPEELTTRKAALLGDFGRTAETTDGIAGLLGNYVLQSVPIGELQSYPAKIGAVDAATIRSAAALLDPAKASVVVVGDAKAFLPALKTARPDVSVIPADKVMLDAPTLRYPPRFTDGRVRRSVRVCRYAPALPGRTRTGRGICAAFRIS